MATPPRAPDWYPDPSGKPGVMYWDGQQWHQNTAADPGPPANPSPLVTQRPRLPTGLIAALVVTLTVLIAIVGATGYLLLQRKNASQTPSARTTLPSDQTAPLSGRTAQTAPPSSAVVPSATAAPATEVPGLAPFLGHWTGGQSGMLDIRSDGTGRWTHSDTSTCPNAPLAGCGITGTADFTLTSVAGGTATGNVTASSNPQNDLVGGPVSIVLGSGLQGQGVVLAVSISKMQGWNFCNDTSPHYCAGG
jgi:Protein of unknown function (DUF2510)